MPVECIWVPGGFGCCPFLGGGSVICSFYLLFNIFLIVCGDSVFVFVLLCITLCLFYFCNRLEEEEIAGCFAFVVLPMSC